MVSSREIRRHVDRAEAWDYGEEGDEAMRR